MFKAEAYASKFKTILLDLKAFATNSAAATVMKKLQERMYTNA
jgi:hypothetical protein